MKRIFCVVSLLLFVIVLSGQTIKQQQQRQKQQQQYEQERKTSEIKEAARQKKAQLSLQDLMQIADMEDLSSVDKMLSSKGWQLKETESEDGLDIVTFAFDYSYSSATFWAYWYQSQSNNDKTWIAYRFADDAQFNQIEKALTSNGFKKTPSEVLKSGSGGIETTYRNNRYEIKTQKRLNETRSGNVAYSVVVINYVKEKEKIEKAFKAEEMRLAKAEFSVEQMLGLLRCHDRNKIDALLEEKGFVGIIYQPSRKNILPKWMGRNGIYVDSILCNDHYYEISSSFELVGDFFELHLCGGPDEPHVLFTEKNSEDNAIYFIGGFIDVDYFIKDVLNNGFELISADSTVYFPYEDYDSVTDYIRSIVFQSKDLRVLLNYFIDDIEGCVSHEILLYNEAQAEARREAEKLKRESERIAQEEAERVRIEKEHKYDEAISHAGNALRMKNFDEAKKYYQKAMTIKPENAKELMTMIDEVSVTALIETADSLVSIKQFEKAKAELEKAFSIQGNTKQAYIEERINEIDTIIAIINNRSIKVFDYKTIHPEDYYKTDNYLTENIKSYLLEKHESISEENVQFVFDIDTFSVTKLKVYSSTSQKLNKNWNVLAKGVRLKPCIIKGYSVMANSSFNYTINYDYGNITFIKSWKGRSSKNKQFPMYKTSILSYIGESAPYAKYTFEINRIRINDNEYNEDKVEKMRIIGGPANAWLSVLVPGLGDHRVSFGKRKGIGVAISTYLLAGAGVGGLLYNHYYPYNPYYQYIYYSMFGCFVAAGVLWISDIIWVAVEGAKNKKNAKQYQQSHFSAFYEPISNTKGLACSIDF